jgi:hypothetical protein
MIVELVRRVQTWPSCNDAAAMSDEDWRVEFELADESLAQGLYTAGGERELAAHAREMHTERAALSLDGPVIFAYAKTREDAEAAQEALTDLAHEEGLEAKSVRVSRWHDVAERWEDVDAPLPVDAQAVAAEREEFEESERAEATADGLPDWEVRVSLPTHRDAVEFAERLQAEGLPTQRHWRYLLLGSATELDAQALANRIREEAPSGSEVVAEGARYLAFRYSPFVLF